jgi:2-keto-3-deoxy-L-rhamnonate aldolase RhmA
MSARPRIGTVVTVPDAVLAELIGSAFEFAWIDLEHGALTVADVPRLAVALRAADCDAEVRLPSWSSEALAPVLDAGVDGVVAPYVERAEDAAAFVRRVRYPPRGDRGYGPRRAGGYGRTAVRHVRCSVQIESANGVDHADAIARVDGIDALVAGCADLALSLGRAPGEPCAALVEAVARVGAAARSGGVRFGIAGASPRLLRELMPAGADAIVHSVDVRLYAAAADGAAALAREVAA